MDRLLTFVMALESLINERDEWANTYTLYSMKRDILRKYGRPDQDLQEAVQELDGLASQAESLLTGTTEALSDHIGFDDPEEARRLLIKLKSLLNAYAEKTGKEFVLSSDIEEKTAEELLKFGWELIKNE